MGCDIHPYVEVRRDGQWVRSGLEVPRDRDYWAFAKLADVRNGLGFAGVDRGDPVTPIAQPRGLPPDTSIHDGDVNAEGDREGIWLGDHSHSWVTLAELLAVNYNEPITQRGLVKHRVAENFRKYGYHPREWVGGISGQGAEEYEPLEWKLPLYEAAGLLPRIIASICHLGKPDDVRLVFGFDS